MATLKEVIPMLQNPILEAYLWIMFWFIAAIALFLLAATFWPELAQAVSEGF
jgi:hypothetical protein